MTTESMAVVYMDLGINQPQLGALWFPSKARWRSLSSVVLFSGRLEQNAPVISRRIGLQC